MTSMVAISIAGPMLRFTCFNCIPPSKAHAKLYRQKEINVKRCEEAHNDETKKQVTRLYVDLDDDLLFRFNNYDLTTRANKIYFPNTGIQIFQVFQIFVNRQIMQLVQMLRDAVGKAVKGRNEEEGKIYCCYVC